MAHLVFVETSGSGVDAMRYAREQGHRITYLFSNDYDFTSTAYHRGTAKELANNTISFDSRANVGGLVKVLQDSGVATQEIDACLSTLAFCVPQAAALAQASGARGLDPQAISLARDKTRFRRRLEEVGLPSLVFREVHDYEEASQAADQIGYPVILKPVLGVAKAATTVATSDHDVYEHFANLQGTLDAVPSGISGHLDSRFLVEELAVGPLFSVEVASDGKTWVALASTRQKVGAIDPILELGCTSPTGLPVDAEAEMRDYAVAICRALGLNLGIFHCEVILTEKGFRATEVNPRIAGGALPETINAVADNNLFRILVDLHLGMPAPSEALHLEGAASHSVLGAMHAQEVPSHLSPHWYEILTEHLHSYSLQATPGTQLPSMRGNFDRFGMIRAVAQNPDSARMLCHRTKETLQTSLGFQLAYDADEALTAGANVAFPALYS